MGFRWASYRRLPVTLMALLRFSRYTSMHYINGWCRIVVAVNSPMRFDARSCMNVFGTSDSKYYRRQSLWDEWRRVSHCPTNWWDFLSSYLQLLRPVVHFSRYFTVIVVLNCVRGVRKRLVQLTATATRTSFLPLDEAVGLFVIASGSDGRKHFWSERNNSKTVTDRGRPYVSTGS